MSLSPKTGSDVLPLDCVVIGAGIAGLACATQLKKAGHRVRLLEKSRGIGGRLATRRHDSGLAFDHGAPYFDVETPSFLHFLQTAPAKSVYQWPDGNVSESNNCFVGAPSMNAFLKQTAAGEIINFTTRVIALTPAPEGCTLTLERGASLSADIVVSTAPAPQTVTMLENAADDDTPLRTLMSGAVMTPCWTLMVAFDEPNMGVGHPVTTCSDGGAMAVAIQNFKKPGRDHTRETWVIHASPDWSAAHLEEPAETVQKLMLDAAAPLLGARTPDHVQTHRWRYAQVSRPAGEPFLANRHGTFYAAGDWCPGGGVEGAFNSGVAAAKAIIERNR